MIYNIIIVGVGGQGTLLASKVLGKVSLLQNLDVKVSEIHGMSQRGGNVITHVKMGEKVLSPLVTEGEADYVLAFEWLEAIRAESFLKPDGLMIVNTQRILPMSVILKQANYPEEPLKSPSLELDAFSLAVEAGNQRCVNTVLLGVLSAQMDWPEEVWLTAIKESTPPRSTEINLKAFGLGRAYGLNARNCNA